jgi:hypothetical protein
MSEARNSGPLATERQKEYARQLDIEFSDQITLAEMSRLIDEAVIRQTEQRYEELGELERREGNAWERMRVEVLAEIDAEDCRLSKAEPEQIVEALSERGLAAILFTFPTDAIFNLGEPGINIEFSTSFNDDMSLGNVENFIKEYALFIWKRDGMDFAAMMEKASDTMAKSSELMAKSGELSDRLYREIKASKDH